MLLDLTLIGRVGAACVCKNKTNRNGSQYYDNDTQFPGSASDGLVHGELDAIGHGTIV
jgi:hypothetical protein